MKYQAKVYRSVGTGTVNNSVEITESLTGRTCVDMRTHKLGSAPLSDESIYKHMKQFGVDEKNVNIIRM